MIKEKAEKFNNTWEEKRVSDFGNIVTGATPSTKIDAYWGEPYPWITPTDISTTRDMIASERFITQEGLDSIRTLPPNTVLVTCIASIGKNAILRTTGSCNQQINAVIPNSLHNSEFLYYLFEFNSNYLLANAGITATNIVSKAAFSTLVFEVPPLKEQRAIANALSDVDGLLSSLETLIAKKRAIKQATMQQLLTGKTRLPGFSGAWETKRLGEIFTIHTGSSKSQYITPGGKYIVVDMGSVATDGQLIISKFTDYEGDFLKEGDLVMPKDDIGGGKIIGKVAYIDANNLYVLGDHVYALRLIAGLPKFFSYLINRYETNSSLKSKVGGSAQLGLSRKAVEEQEIPIPTYEEQNAIASVLSDMDAEIAALEERRDKTIAIKQGMMQQLLTGRVRLVESKNVNKT
ncbi:MAG: restriction endonuclease subunit S [Candidatus Poribacteria bacterium]|nr:restriction endonuclease subunit S [Candidatus Poribacteria bacterium]